MTAPLTAAELAAILARAEAATVGPWARETGELLVLSRDGEANGTPLVKAQNEYRRWGRELNLDGHVANMDFIAACREDVPRLVAELTRAREALRLALPWVCAYVSDPPADDEAQAALDAVVAALGEEEPADGEARP